MSARRPWSYIVGIIGVATAMTLAYIPATFAETAANFSIVQMQEDRIYNYDQISQSTVAASNSDWPVTMVFTNGASIDAVKIGIYWGIAGATASPMNGRFNDGAGYMWDVDSGTKSSINCASSGVKHMRLYATPYPYDKNYNLSWGYYVFGTTHFDRHECWQGQFGWSEEAENTMAIRARDKNCTVVEDSINFQNVEDTNLSKAGIQVRVEGNHVWQNNGLATRVYVDGSCPA